MTDAGGVPLDPDFVTQARTQHAACLQEIATLSERLTHLQAVVHRLDGLLKALDGQESVSERHLERRPEWRSLSVRRALIALLQAEGELSLGEMACRLLVEGLDDAAYSRYARRIVFPTITSEQGRATFERAARGVYRLRPTAE